VVPAVSDWNVAAIAKPQIHIDGDGTVWVTGPVGVFNFNADRRSQQRDRRRIRMARKRRRGYA
jgi:hypothetical protein